MIGRAAPIEAPGSMANCSGTHCDQRARAERLFHYGYGREFRPDQDSIDDALHGGYLSPIGIDEEHERERLFPVGLTNPRDDELSCGRRDIGFNGNEPHAVAGAL